LPHCVLAIPHPDCPERKDKYIIVDMTRMQLGEGGRGIYGENYFLGLAAQWFESRSKFSRLCEVHRGVETDLDNLPNNEHTNRLLHCVKRALERWNNREVEGWCNHCGKGGKDLLRCAGCTKKVWYCCKEHQAAGWKLHNLTCEK
jgi:hypothetical protein